MKPRKHAEFIHAYADGKDIQMLCEDDDIEVWVDSPEPKWDPNLVYRIKPMEYPPSTLHYDDLCRIWNDTSRLPGGEGHATKALRVCADEAVICFIQSGELHKFVEKHGTCP